MAVQYERSSSRRRTARVASFAFTGAPRWLVFIHQLPPHPSKLRVSTWRRLRQLGALPLKQAVYVLPDTPDTREDFEWLKAEVGYAGGDASVFVADQLDRWSDDALIDEFRQASQKGYQALGADIEKALMRLARSRRKQKPGSAIPRLLDAFRHRLKVIETTDFFGSAGRDRVTALLTQVAEHGVPPAATHAATASGERVDRQQYRGRLWVTRPRPGVDRMSSAWLIRRFIDPQARFDFRTDRNAVPDVGVPFDMFGVQFSHRGDLCTFETLCSLFGIKDPAVERIAAIVHDLDLKDERFGAPETATIGALVEGLQLAQTDDDALLTQGMATFEALYKSLQRDSRPARPRAVASLRTASTVSRRRRHKGR